MKEVASFKIEYLQFLNEKCEEVQKLPELAHDHQTLIKLYRHMTLIRLFDNKAIALQRTGNLGTYPPLLGQEAIPTGVAHAMTMDDILCSYYRNQGELLMRGVSMVEILTFWGGDERGSNFANNPQDTPLCIPIGTQCQQAVGLGYAIKLRKEPRAVVLSIGDGGTSEGAFYEGINAAGVWNLPLVVVINNNQWAISVPRSKQTAAQTIAQKAIAAGIPGIQVDGNDLFAVHYATDQALKKARRGEGPTVIEALTYRLCSHTTADDPTRYVPEQELKAAFEIEPIARLKKYMMQHKFWSDKQQTELEESCRQEVEAAAQEYLAKAKEPSSPQAMMEHLFAKVPEPFMEQYRALGEIK